jgi:hypothetical protein
MQHERLAKRGVLARAVGGRRTRYARPAGRALAIGRRGAGIASVVAVAILRSRALARAVARAPAGREAEAVSGVGTRGAGTAGGAQSSRPSLTGSALAGSRKALRAHTRSAACDLVLSARHAPLPGQHAALGAGAVRSEQHHTGVAAIVGVVDAARDQRCKPREKSDPMIEPASVTTRCVRTFYGACEHSRYCKTACADQGLVAHCE